MPLPLKGPSREQVKEKAKGLERNGVNSWWWQIYCTIMNNLCLAFCAPSWIVYSWNVDMTQQDVLLYNSGLCAAAVSGVSNNFNAPWYPINITFVSMQHVLPAPPWFIHDSCSSFSVYGECEGTIEDIIYTAVKSNILKWNSFHWSTNSPASRPKGRH